MTLHRGIPFAWRTFALAASIALVASAAEAQLIIYDDFSTPRLSADRWEGRQIVTSDGGTGSALEIQRGIQNSRLVLDMRATGGISGGGGTITSENALLFANPNRLTEIAFKVALGQTEVTGCAAGGEAVSGARGVYALFNDGTGDVIATIEAGRSSAGATDLLEVVGSLVHRDDTGTSSIGTVSLGSWPAAQAVRLRVKWDPAHSAVLFQKDGEAAVSIAYTTAVVGPAFRSRKYLASFVTVTDCAAGPASNARALALINNVIVRVNPEP
jgi:hypothetical protein